MPNEQVRMTLDHFFGEKQKSRQLFEVVTERIKEIGPCEIRVTKSQIAFRRPKAFAWVWMPEQTLRRLAAPLVLSLALPYRDSSTRWKEIVEPAAGRFMHHLELNTLAEIDAEVQGWLTAAWQMAA